MKLLILKVSDHRDPQIITSVWRAIFGSGQSFIRCVQPQTHGYVVSVEAQTEQPPPQAIAERIRKLGQKVYPSDIAFPCGEWRYFDRRTLFPDWEQISCAPSSKTLHGIIEQTFLRGGHLRLFSKPVFPTRRFLSHCTPCARQE